MMTNEPADQNGQAQAPATATKGMSLRKKVGLGCGAALLLCFGGCVLLTVLAGVQQGI